MKDEYYIFAAKVREIFKKRKYTNNIDSICSTYVKFNIVYINFSLMINNKSHLKFMDENLYYKSHIREIHQWIHEIITPAFKMYPNIKPNTIYVYYSKSDEFISLTDINKIKPNR